VVLQAELFVPTRCSISAVHVAEGDEVREGDSASMSIRHANSLSTVGPPPRRPLQAIRRSKETPASGPMRAQASSRRQSLWAGDLILAPDFVSIFGHARGRPFGRARPFS